MKPLFKTSFLCIILTFFITLGTVYSQSETYEIGGVKVSGAQVSEPNAIIAVSGLKVGDKIQIPGTAIPKAIKTLWRLRLFKNVEVLKEKTVGDVIFLEIKVEESARLASYEVKGIKKSKVDNIKALIGHHFLKGGIITQNAKANSRNAIEQYFIEDGYPDVQVSIREIPIQSSKNEVKLQYEIDRGKRRKVEEISFSGNKQVSDKKLRKLLSTKRKGRLFGSSKLIKSQLEIDKRSIIQHYNSLGYRDAKITYDSIWRSKENNWMIHFVLEEGRQYYFGDIKWKGNTNYSTKELEKILGIKKGEVYNKELLDMRLSFSPDGRDVSTLYMDNGYLFFRAEPIETAIHDNTIDLEIRILEGPQATIDKVSIKGNDRTHEHVIRRELRTEPGKKFSRSDIIRSQREIINLGYFNPESLDINTSVNPERGTVDVEYVVEEKQDGQFELSAGWGGSGVGITGTLGVTFNNFSLRNLFSGENWNPLPSGDGQRLSFRIQSNGKAYQSYNLSFTEPWLGGKKPNSLNVGFFYNNYFDESTTDASASARFHILGINASLGTRLKFPDDNFVASTTLSFQRYGLSNWSSGLFRDSEGQLVSNGTFYNLSLSQTIARSTINNPIYPTAGSKLELSLKFTPPFSLLSNEDYSDASTEEKFKWLEYHKWRFDAEWYTSIVGKLVLKTSAKFGYLGSYNSAIGTSPFERFQLGGDGLSNIQGGFTGTDLIALRGYEVTDLENNILNGEATATPLFNKFTVELRYPLSLNPNATIFGLGFFEAGNAWQSFDDYNPFDLKRSVGLGLRVFLPMFGMLGFDYGIGFDKNGANSLGKFSIILGFEPD